MTLEQAIKALETEYERAKKLEWVYNPLAYALHRVWRKADTSKQGRPRKDDKNADTT